MHKLTILLVLTFVFFQCSHSSQSKGTSSGDELPNWVHNPHDSYPKSMYLVGIGSGDTRTSAENNAIGAISKIFQAKVDVDETVLEEYLEDNKGISFTSQILNKTRVGSNQELKNITIEKSFFYQKEGLYYVLAYMDRLETEELFRSDIERNNQRTSEFYQKYQNADNKLSRYAYLQKAINLQEINRVLDAQYRIISTMGESIEPPVAMSQLLQNRRDLLNQISVAVNVTGDHQQEITDYIKSVIGRIGFKISDSQPDFEIKASLDMRPTNLNREDVTGYNWKLTLDVFDVANQYGLNTFSLKNRTLAISEDQAISKTMNTIESGLNKTFYQQFTQYLQSL